MQKNWHFFSAKFETIFQNAAILSIFNIFKNSKFIICRMLSSLTPCLFFLFQAPFFMDSQEMAYISAITSYFNVKKFVELHWIMLNIV